MHFVTLTKVSNFIKNKVIHAFHYDMFHGLAERGGRAYPHDKTIWYDSDDNKEPLLISRTGTCIPDICQPSSQLVVSDRIAKRLQTLPHIRLAPVKFTRLVDVAYRKGDMTYQDVWGVCDPLDLLRNLPDVPRMHERVGTYWEVQICRLDDIVGGFPTTSKVTIEVSTPPYRVLEETSLSDDLLREYPIVWDRAIIMSMSAYQLVHEHVDRDFFIVREYDVG